MQKSALTATSNRRLKNPTVGRARWLRKTTFHAQNVLLQPLERGKERGNGRRSTSSALARMHTHTHTHHLHSRTRVQLLLWVAMVRWRREGRRRKMSVDAARGGCSRRWNVEVAASQSTWAHDVVSRKRPVAVFVEFTSCHRDALRKLGGRRRRWWEGSEDRFCGRGARRYSRYLKSFKRTTKAKRQMFRKPLRFLPMFATWPTLQMFLKPVWLVFVVLQPVLRFPIGFRFYCMAAKALAKLIEHPGVFWRIAKCCSRPFSFSQNCRTLWCSLSPPLETANSLEDFSRFNETF